MNTLHPALHNARILLRQERTRNITAIKRTGIRETARKTGLTAMMVSRYCTFTGADDALSHLILTAIATPTPRQPTGDRDRPAPGQTRPPRRRPPRTANRRTIK